VAFSSLLAFAEIGFYGLSSGLYLGYHLGAGPKTARVGSAFFLVGFLVQLFDIGVRCFQLQHPLSSTAEALAFVAWALAGGFLWASWRHKIVATGAFAVPTVLVLVVLARVLPAEGAAEPSAPLATVHVLLSTLGEAFFAFAAVLSVLFLIQERRLKNKDFSALRTQAAPLEKLDRLAARCVFLGFPIFTLAIVSGAILIARRGLVQHDGGLRVEYGVAVIAWFAYGLLLFARKSGWPRRRIAWLTVGGFAGAVLVLLGYFVRQVI